MIINLPFKNLKFPVTQLFGERYIYNGKVVSHKGVDWAMPKLTPLLAPFSGLIYRVELTRNWGYGRTVYIETECKKLGKMQAILAHCEDITVSKGDKVKKGNFVAYSGNSGYWRGKTGYHLHFGLKVKDIFVDPLSYFNLMDPNQDQLFPETRDKSKLKSFHGEYVVQKKDTLWKISESFYNNGGHYMEIFNVNQDILSNPNKIKPGQVLRIPVLINKGI